MPSRSFLIGTYSGGSSFPQWKQFTPSGTVHTATAMAMAAAITLTMVMRQQFTATAMRVTTPVLEASTTRSVAIVSPIKTSHLAGVLRCLRQSLFGQGYDAVGRALS